jgi:hypothetical protein
MLIMMEKLVWNNLRKKLYLNKKYSKRKMALKILRKNNYQKIFLLRPIE